MNDLISRQAAIRFIRDQVSLSLFMKRSVDKADKACMELCEMLDRELPPAQPETAKRIVGKSKDGMTLWYQCDMCNEPVDEQDNYCRGCGRRLTDE